MCRNFFPGISGGVLTPLTPPLDPPLTGIETDMVRYVENSRFESTVYRNNGRWG